MATESFMDKLRMFLGIRQEPPRNDFRNPIWGSDDDDDGDELYSRQNLDSFNVDIHQEITKQMQDMLKSFGGIFGDMKSFFHDDHFETFAGITDLPPAPSDPENFNSNSIREHYLKPGYHSKHEIKEDIDLDGKISSQEISGLLKNNEDVQTIMPVKPFDGKLVPGRSYCQTIITTSITKPDGTIETRRIVKNGNEVIEETTTSSAPDSRSPHNPGLTSISPNGIILSDLVSLFKNFY